MQFRQLILAASALVMAGASRALGQGPSAPVAGDSVLQSLVAEALARNPTVAQRQAAVRAATLRIRQAPRRKAIPSRPSWPAIACGPRSSHWRASESPRSLR